MNDDKLSKNTCFALIMLLPFIVFAAIAFLPWWVSAPLTIVGTLLWAGSVLYLPEAK